MKKLSVIGVRAVAMLLLAQFVSGCSDNGGPSSTDDAGGITGTDPSGSGGLGGTGVGGSGSGGNATGGLGGGGGTIVGGSGGTVAGGGAGGTAPTGGTAGNGTGGTAAGGAGGTIIPDPIVRLSVAPVAFDFSNAVNGTVGTTKVFTVVNAGNIAANPLMVSINGAAASSFELASNTCGASFPPGICQVSVTFKPKALGALNATLLIGTPNQLDAMATLSGKGIESGQLTVSASAIDFGVVAADKTVTRTITVTNSSQQTVTNVTVSLKGDEGFGGRVLGSPCYMVAPAGTCTIEFSFHPILRYASSSVATLNGGPAGLALVSLTGSKDPTGQDIEFLLTPASYDFGDVMTGEIGPPVTFTFAAMIPSGQSTGPVSLLARSFGGSGLTVSADTCTGKVLTDTAPICTFAVAPGRWGVLGPLLGTVSASATPPTKTATSVVRMNVVLSPLSQALIGYWPLDQDTQDASGNTNHGQVVSGGTTAAGASTPLFASGKVQGALLLDGQQQWMKVPSSVSLDRVNVKQTFSVTFWANPRDIPASGEMFALSRGGTIGGLAFGVGTKDRKWFARDRFGDAISTMNGITELWTHVAVTFDGIGLTIYVNGIEGSRVVGAFDISPTTAPFVIGGKANQAAASIDSNWDGLLDEVRLYDRVLTAAEVQADKNR